MYGMAAIMLLSTLASVGASAYKGVSSAKQRRMDEAEAEATSQGMWTSDGDMRKFGMGMTTADPGKGMAGSTSPMSNDPNGIRMGNKRRNMFGL